MVNCPKCDAAIDVDEDDLDEGDALTCEECGANLNVSGVSPLELAPEEDADADDDDEDEDEDEDFDEDEDDDDDDEDDDDKDGDDWK
jgi:alpha-aminoadipate/glutamate carrier protein LysW